MRRLLSGLGVVAAVVAVALIERALRAMGVQSARTSSGDWWWLTVDTGRPPVEGRS